MLGLAIRKMWNKKWMNLCLLIGIVLMVASLVSFPLYQTAASDRMLSDCFSAELEQSGKYPAINSLTTFSKKDKKGKTIKKMEKYMAGLDEDLGVNSFQNIRYYSLSSSSMVSDMNRPDILGMNVRLACMSGLEDQVQILYGDTLSDSGLTDDGAIEVIVHESCLIEKGLLINETLTLENVQGPDNKPVRIYIKGVYNEADKGDFYWQIDKLDLLNVCFMKEDLFREYFCTDRVGKYNITCEYFHLFTYEDLTYDDAVSLYNRIKYLTEKSKYKSVYLDSVYKPILEEYLNKQTRIRGTLLILQVPVLILVAAFLLMISSKMYEMEKNEISVIKSRGGYRGQIFLLYLYQNLILVIIGGGLGILLGRGFATLLSSTRNFLEFNIGLSIPVAYTREGFIYALAGMFFSLVCLSMPSIPNSKVSIVNLKASRGVKKKPLWEKLFLDIILLGVSGYTYFTYSKKLTDLSSAILSGESLDPLLYLGSSLFILGAGLLYLRIQPLLIDLIFLIGKRKWGPASYISFMENKKNTKRSQVIMLFLVMTISLGMYHAVVARTILDNALENRNYLDGADVILKEKWMQVKDENGMSTGEYIEPDYQKYLTADFTKNATRVFYDKEAYYSADKTNRQLVTVMGIHTKEFGSLTDLPDGLNEKSYYTYLNELAEVSNGVLVSSNFKSAYDLDIGDTIYYKSSSGKEASGVIVDYIDYFPGFSTQAQEMDAEGNAHFTEGFLIVAHFSDLSKKWRGTPYEVWINTGESDSTSTVYQFIETKKIPISKYKNKSEDISSVISDPLLQGTNGILTLGFGVTIILCGIGYLIFQIMSVRERELIFGVVRAWGLHSGELIKILFLEQIFTGILSCVAGAGIGYVASRLYVPLIQYAYASADQTLPMGMLIYRSDMIRLYAVIGSVMILSMIVLTCILKQMNITRALKLGEE